MKKKYELPILTNEQLNRLEEIRFYLFTSKMTKLFNKKTARNSFNELLALLSDLTDTDSIILEQAYILVNKESARPSTQDIIVLMKYQEIPYEFIAQNFVSYRKIYEYLDEFISGYSTDLLEPRLDKEIVKEVKRFNKEFTENIYPALYILGNDIVNGQQIKMKWDD